MLTCIIKFCVALKGNVLNRIIKFCVALRGIVSYHIILCGIRDIVLYRTVLYYVALGVLYCTASCCIVWRWGILLYCIMLYCMALGNFTVLHHMVLCGIRCIALHHIVLCGIRCIVLHHMVLCAIRCIVLHHIVLGGIGGIVLYLVLYCTATQCNILI